MTKQFISGLTIWRKGRRISPQAFVFDAFSAATRQRPFPSLDNSPSRDFAVVMAQRSRGPRRF
jgi:hypothetical protein